LLRFFYFLLAQPFHRSSTSRKKDPDFRNKYLKGFETFTDDSLYCDRKPLCKPFAIENFFDDLFNKDPSDRHDRRKAKEQKKEDAK
jgi:hypothetical protein